MTANTFPIFCVAPDGRYNWAIVHHREKSIVTLSTNKTCRSVLDSDPVLFSLAYLYTRNQLQLLPPYSAPQVLSVAVDMPYESFIIQARQRLLVIRSELLYKGQFENFARAIASFRFVQIWINRVREVCELALTGVGGAKFIPPPKFFK